MNVSVTIRIEAGEANSISEVPVSQSALDAVLFHFNPSDNPKVARIKALHAALIHEMDELRDDPTSLSAQKRGAAVAITQLESSQMAAVKALFAKR